MVQNDPRFMSSRMHAARLACDCLRDISEDQTIDVSARQAIDVFCQTHGLQRVVKVEAYPGRWMPRDVPASWYGIHA